MRSILIIAIGLVILGRTRCTTLSDNSDGNKASNSNKHASTKEDDMLDRDAADCGFLGR